MPAEARTGVVSDQKNKALRARRGASLTGYGLVVGLIAILALSAVDNVGGSVAELFGDVGVLLTNTAAGASGSSSGGGSSSGSSSGGAGSSSGASNTAPFLIAGSSIAEVTYGLSGHDVTLAVLALFDDSEGDPLTVQSVSNTETSCVTAAVLSGEDILIDTSALGDCTGSFDVVIQDDQGGQTSAVSISVPVAQACLADAFSANTVLLIQPDTDDVSITDLSSNSYTVSSVNGAGLSSSVADPWGGSSQVISFNEASAQMIEVPDSTDWFFNTGDFTVEVFFYRTDGTTRVLPYWQHVDAANSWRFFIAPPSDNRAFLTNETGSSKTVDAVSAATSVSNNAWHHLAGTRSGSTFRIFLDGVEIDTHTDSSAFNDFSAPLSMGGTDEEGGSYFTGLMTSFRVTKGVARYTSGFTPSTVPFCAP